MGAIAVGADAAQRLKQQDETGERQPRKQYEPFSHGSLLSHRWVIPTGGLASEDAIAAEDSVSRQPRHKDTDSRTRVSVRHVGDHHAAVGAVEERRRIAELGPVFLERVALHRVLGA